MLLTHAFTIEEVNNLSSENFVRIFGNVVEHLPAVAIVILKKRPFSEVRDIVNACFNYLDSLKLSEKLKVVQLYPDIIEKLTYLSQLHLEGDITGTDQLSIEEKRKLKELNNKYKEKFGFPFIKGSKEKYIWTIFSEIASRLENEVENEIQVAFDEVKNIVKLRIHEIVR
ncbi:hypothetical protein NQ317_001424 [Molorchus minor]|uniref:2-oxo-4-hydroxy-4-carboxy-5-ureidoimidazoline decarboxylase n=1 Tax=Molorchus minor TaxID=1323400 RepID=A0ABQ9JY23_9CUCU|nr:hypothetical protein NQ317_001424 [Molorchus minor]